MTDTVRLTDLKYMLTILGNVDLVALWASSARGSKVVRTVSGPA